MKLLQTTRRLIACGAAKKQYIVQLILVVIIGILNVVSAYALGRITRNITAKGGEDLLCSIGVFAAMILGIALLDWYRSIRITRLTETAESNYRKRTARALMKAEYLSIQKLESGDLIGRVVSECRFAASNSELLMNGLRHVLIPVILIAVMLWVDWRVGLGYSLLLIPILVYPRLTKNSLSDIPPYRKAFAVMTAQAKDLIANRTTVKAYRLEKQADQWVHETAEDYRQKGVRGIGKIYTANISALGINVLPMFGCAIVGAYLVFNKLLSVEALVVALMLASVATEELLKLPNVMVNFPSGVIAGERLFALWDLPAETGGTQTKAQSATAVEFSNVSFCYPEQDHAEPPLLNGLTFSVKQGEKIALVGHSGCGKSTILKLITGLLRPQEGTVSVYGTDVNDWDLQALREHMSVLQQSPFVFQGTVKDNILLGNAQADELELVCAAEQARLSQWIGQQAEGWHADTGEQGALLSGGLRQRVGLARLFLKDASIELLDEATSALDANHQKEILDALRDRGTGKTCIMIAHRLSSVTDADCILFLHEGKIAERGTHEQLLEKQGLYYALYTAQEKGDVHDA